MGMSCPLHAHPMTFRCTFAFGPQGGKLRNDSRLGGKVYMYSGSRFHMLEEVCRKRLLLVNYSATTPDSLRNRELVGAGMGSTMNLGM